MLFSFFLSLTALPDKAVGGRRCARLKRLGKKALFGLSQRCWADPVLLDYLFGAENTSLGVAKHMTCPIFTIHRMSNMHLLDVFGNSSRPMVSKVISFDEGLSLLNLPRSHKEGGSTVEGGG